MEVEEEVEDGVDGEAASHALALQLQREEEEGLKQWKEQRGRPASAGGVSPRKPKTPVVPAAAAAAAPKGVWGKGASAAERLRLKPDKPDLPVQQQQQQQQQRPRFDAVLSLLGEGDLAVW